MATRRLYFNLVKLFKSEEITSILGELSLLESMGFTFPDKEDLKNKILDARNSSSGNNFQKMTQNFSEKATRNLLNECGVLLLKNQGTLLEVIPVRPIGCYILRKKTSTGISNTLYSNLNQMFDDIRKMDGFSFDISLIQKRISQAISDNAVLDFALCRKDFEFAKIVSESLVPFEYGVRFISANEILEKEIEVLLEDGANSLELFALHYMGHLDMYTASIFVKNTPDNLKNIKKLISKFCWQDCSHFWFTEPLEEVLEHINI